MLFAEVCVSLCNGVTLFAVHTFQTLHSSIYQFSPPEEAKVCMSAAYWLKAARQHLSLDSRFRHEDLLWGLLEATYCTVRLRTFGLGKGEVKRTPKEGH